MIVVDSPESLQGTAELLGAIRKKGVTLWAEHGRLHYQAPKGALTREELEQLRRSKEQLLAILSKTSMAQVEESALQLPPQCVPLTFSQVAHWHLYELNARPGMRQVASATRVRGALNVAALRHSLGEVVRRHDALRTSIVVIDGMPVQHISEAIHCELPVHDVTMLPDSEREHEVRRLYDETVTQPIDVAKAPLFGIRLLRLRPDEHVLILAFAHIVSDAVSGGIFLRELFAAYEQSIRGEPFALPAIAMQFSAYAVRQRATHAAWLARHGSYWDERLAGCRRLRFPQDGDECPAREGWEIVSIRIGPVVKEKLRDWCRVNQTTLVMGAFTAYVALVLRWCDAADAVFSYQTDGREDPRVEHAIGYFANVLHLRIELLDRDSFPNLLRRVVKEYYNAFQHADACYIDSLHPAPEIAWNTGFNWVRQGPHSAICEVGKREDAVECTPIHFPYPGLRLMSRDAEPAILLFDTEEEIVGHVYFPRRRFSTSLMTRFAANYAAFLEHLVDRSGLPVKAVPVAPQAR